MQAFCFKSNNKNSWNGIFLIDFVNVKNAPEIAMRNSDRSTGLMGDESIYFGIHLIFGQ